MKLTHIYLFLALVLSRGMMAQDSCRFTFAGTIIDGETGSGFQYANVYISELKKGTVTDESGNFRFTALCAGKITLVYSALGYKTFRSQYKINENTEDKIILHTDTCQLESVTVYGKKEEHNTTDTKSVLTGKALDRTRGLSLGDALTELPGVTTLKTGNSISKPVIHGLHSNRVLMLNAGLRQEGQQWGNEHAPEIDPFVSDKLTVVKGAAGLRYGSDAIAGVVIVEPRALPDSAGINAELNLAGMSNGKNGTVSGILEGKMGKWFPLKWRLQGTLKKAGNVKTPNYYQANTGFQEQNFSYALGYDKRWFSGQVFYSQFNTTLGIFSGSHIGSLNDLNNAIERKEPAVKSDFSYDIQRPFQHVEHELASIKLSASIRGAGRLIFTGGRQFNNRSEFDVLRSSSENLSKENPQLQLKLTTWSADLVFEHKSWKGFTGSMGTAYTRQANIWKGRFLIPNYVSQTLGGFFLETWSKKRLELEAGVRYDIKELNAYFNNEEITRVPRNFSNFSETLGASFKLNRNLSWKTSAGSTWRAPNVSELFSMGLHHGAAAIENGNPDLKAEKAFKVVSSLEVKSNKLTAEGSLYYNKIDDFIYLKPDMVLIQTIRGAFPSFTYTQVDAAFYGADLSLNYKLFPSLNLIARGSAVLAKDITDHSYLVNIPPVRYNPGLIYSPKWISKKSLAYLRITVNRTEYQNRIPDNIDYAGPPKAYTLLDAEIGSDVFIGQQKISLIFQVSNIFNTVYRDYMNRFRYYTDEPGRNFSVRIKVPLQIYNPG